MKKQTVLVIGITFALIGSALIWRISGYSAPEAQDQGLGLQTSSLDHTESVQPAPVEVGAVPTDAQAIGKSIRELETEIRAMGYVERLNSGQASAQERSRFAVIAEELTRLRAKKIADEIASLQSEIRDQIKNFEQE